MSVYFIYHNGCIKIGASVNPWARLSSLQTAHHERLEMLAIMPGDQAEERALHRRFSQYHKAGEWFNDNDDLRRFIQEVRQRYPDLQSAPEPPAPELPPPAQLPHFDSQAIEKACALLELFRQCGGVVEVTEHPDRFVIGLPGTTYEGGYDPTKLYNVAYDDGQMTPKIGREMKLRTLTDRLNEAMMSISYFIKPSLYWRDGYGVYLRFNKPPAAPQENQP